MYKKLSKFGAGAPSLVKSFTGLPQTDELTQQRRRTTQANPIVPSTGACIYCGGTAANRRAVLSLQAKVKKIEAQLNELRLLRSRYNTLYSRHTALLESLPPQYRPRKRKRRQR